MGVLISLKRKMCNFRRPGHYQHTSSGKKQDFYTPQPTVTTPPLTVYILGEREIYTHTSTQTQKTACHADSERLEVKRSCTALGVTTEASKDNQGSDACPSQTPAGYTKSELQV